MRVFMLVGLIFASLACAWEDWGGIYPRTNRRSKSPESPKPGLGITKSAPASKRLSKTSAKFKALRDLDRTNTEAKRARTAYHDLADEIEGEVHRNSMGPVRARFESQMRTFEKFHDLKNLKDSQVEAYGNAAKAHTVAEGLSKEPDKSWHAERAARNTLKAQSAQAEADMIPAKADFRKGASWQSMLESDRNNRLRDHGPNDLRAFEAAQHAAVERGLGQAQRTRLQQLYWKKNDLRNAGGRDTDSSDNDSNWG